MKSITLAGGHVESVSECSYLLTCPHSTSTGCHARDDRLVVRLHGPNGLAAACFSYGSLTLPNMKLQEAIRQRWRFQG